MIPAVEEISIKKKKAKEQLHLAGIIKGEKGTRRDFESWDCLSRSRRRRRCRSHRERRRGERVLGVWEVGEKGFGIEGNGRCLDDGGNVIFLAVQVRKGR